jgi:short-subunit dehydrogenase involved in D-alanine esterification of teichoic acids
LTIFEGGSGLGLIIAQTLESNGAKVYITGRNAERLQEAVKTAVRHTAPTSIFQINL